MVSSWGSNGLNRGFFPHRRLATDFAEALTLALILEPSAYPKPGNVHRLRDRPKLRYEAFLATGVLAYKYFKRGITRGIRGYKRVVLGDLVYGLVRDVAEKVNSSNTCLGSSLLLSLLSVSAGRCIANTCTRVEELVGYSKHVISSTKVLDSIYYYMAIRVASPSHIKPSDYTGEYVNVWDADFKEKLKARKQRLYEILLYSSKFDIVASEAIEGFPRGIKAESFLRSRIEVNRELNRSIIETYLYLLSSNIDTIILLKYGYDTATEVSKKALLVLNEVLSAEENWVNIALEFDKELYDKGLNPGAVADLVAETLALYMLRNVLSGSRILDLSY
jgi:triphosphoribosyl-dephospho-CoA synthase